jgi:very-short-patch-repair endonuclease
VELDGYFHFQNAAAYRRDRRKDFELQRRGYRVLRFLSADADVRLDEILDSILAAVDHCQARPIPEKARC